MENFNTLDALKAAADRGEPASVFELAERYRYGDGLKESPARAAYYYAVAAELGVKKAHYALGECYRDGYGAEKNPVESKNRFRAAGEAGIAKGYTEVGKILEESANNVATATKYGDDESYRNALSSELEKNYRLASMGGDAEGQYRYAMILKTRGDLLSAERWFQEAERGGYPNAAYELAQIEAERGNLDAAFLFFESAAKSGVAEAEFCLAEFLYRGIVTRKDPTRARFYYRKAIEHGKTAAAFPLSRMCFGGEGGASDFALGKKYLDLALEAEIPAAYAYLGTILEHGRYGFSESADRAAEAYRKAAEIGDPDGKAYYGKMLILGIGEAADFDKALRFIEESAAENSCVGAYYLGYCYEKGFGVAIDYEKAVEYYGIAKKEDVFDAQKRIELLKERIH